VPYLLPVGNQITIIKETNVRLRKRHSNRSRGCQLTGNVAPTIPTFLLYAIWGCIAFYGEIFSGTLSSIVLNSWGVTRLVDWMPSDLEWYFRRKLWMLEVHSLTLLTNKQPG